MTKHIHLGSRAVTDVDDKPNDFPHPAVRHNQILATVKKLQVKVIWLSSGIYQDTNAAVLKKLPGDMA